VGVGWGLIPHPEALGGVPEARGSGGFFNKTNAFYSYFGQNRNFKAILIN